MQPSQNSKNHLASGRNVPQDVMLEDSPKPYCRAALTPKQTLPFLDIFRGLAAVAVMMFHIIQHYGWESFPDFFGFGVMARGWMGVDFLFVLSGFLIANSIIFLEKTPKPNQTIRYAVSRCSRIVPLYALNIALILLLLEPAILSSDQFVYHIWLKALFLHSFDFFAFHSINPVLWSIAVEVQFYVLIYATRRWWMSSKPWKFCLVTLSATWAIRSLVWWYASTIGLAANKLPILFLQLPTMLDLFALGVAVALLKENETCKGVIERNKWTLILGTLFAGSVCFSIYHFNAVVWDNPLMVIFWRSTLALFFAGLILTVIQFKPPKIGTHFYAVLSYIGFISYGIYVWHLPIIEVLSPYLYEYPAVFVACVVSVTMVISALTWETFEKPIIKSSKFVMTNHGRHMGSKTA